jgi:long-chain acyl-CoA synthetase
MINKIMHLFPALQSWRDNATATHAIATLAEATTLLSDKLPDPGDWHTWLDETRHPDFLECLPDSQSRSEWCDLAVAAIQASNYSLETLMEQRVERHPDLALFRPGTESEGQEWSYSAVHRRSRAFAAAVYRLSDQPRVALITPNCMDGAILDLGCLLHGILITPLAPNIDLDTLNWILDRLEIDVLVTGQREQHLLGVSARENREHPIHHLILDDTENAPEDCRPIEKLIASLSAEDIDTQLAAAPRFGLDDIATVMFTSGSTGRPKGVSFSLLNLVSKRFARAAALPTVGRDEVLLCYLPLFHTFGRYLEMLGCLFWGGSYVFTGNASKSTLLSQFPNIHPTGLISIPLRWQQIYDECFAGSEHNGEEKQSGAKLKSLVGDRLRWGLSAAGYLDPKTFRFFQRHGVALCSGFGMTEGTGGITMTPPGDYVEDSVGMPLPGIKIRLGDNDEMQITGPYVAGYLDGDKDPGDDSWLPTGDIFRHRDGGHLQIVDRLKDIYKNSRGQTIAPRRVEQKYTDVPGFERVFLVGDHRNYNVLLIVPNLNDPVVQDGPRSDSAHAYYHRIVTLANAELAPFERVINFAVLDRDFSLEEGELTPKGSYRRKTITENFDEVIDELYQTDAVVLRGLDRPIRLPRWFFRDLGILETDITTTEQGLRDVVRNCELDIEVVDDNLVRIGDLVYEIDEDTVDLGLLARHPMLWVGNGPLAAFCPIKEGWDSPLGPITEHVAIQTELAQEDPDITPDTSVEPTDGRLGRIHELACASVRSRGNSSKRAVEALGRILELADHRTAELIRRRIEVMSNHPDMSSRCTAYRLIVLDEPAPSDEMIRPKFLSSGLPFLDSQTIDAISEGVVEERRLQAFRRRLSRYRDKLPWPVDQSMREQFDRIFHLLSGFARHQPSFYGPVRDELVSWILLRDDPAIATMAEQHVQKLARWYESYLDKSIPWGGPAAWHEKIAFQDGMSDKEMERLKEVFIGTTFLQQSVLLAIEGESLDIRDVPRDGIWISRNAVRNHQRVYRVAINTTEGKHFDLLVVVWDHDILESNRDNLVQTIYWLIKLSGRPGSEPVIPRFGCYRPDVSALSLAFVGNLNVWERIREYASSRVMDSGTRRESAWRRLFVQAFATYFRAWAHSDETIVPGMITPMNVSVPDPDFRTGSKVLSMSGWQESSDTLSLVRPMLRHFYKQTEVNYPWTRKILELSWISDACVEALGRKRALTFLSQLMIDLEGHRLDGYRGRLVRELEAKIEELRRRPYRSCAQRGAITRYARWGESAPDASPRARLRQVEEMLKLYGLDRGTDLDRCTLYRHTYFQHASAEVHSAFDNLLQALFESGEGPVLGLVELSDLQLVLENDAQRLAFKRMIFPGSRDGRPQILAVGEEGEKQVILQTRIADKQDGQYTVREPLDPSEIGKLYRLFFKAGYYRTISQNDRFYVVIDAQEQIIGGISWQDVDGEVVHLNGIVVATSLLGRGISSVLIEDFCGRLTNLGFEAVKTLFVLRPFFERHGFLPDRRWGGLVRILEKVKS